jgi:hypothetical protein
MVIQPNLIIRPVGGSCPGRGSLAADGARAAAGDAGPERATHGLLKANGSVAAHIARNKSTLRPLCPVPRSSAMTDRPRTFAELVAAMNPAERGRLERAEHYADHTVKNDFHAQVWLLEDRDAPGEWRVEYQDEDGGGYVTIFAGPAAERRARSYYEALQAKRLPTIREGASPH